MAPPGPVWSLGLALLAGASIPTGNIPALPRANGAAIPGFGLFSCRLVETIRLAPN